MHFSIKLTLLFYLCEVAANAAAENASDKQGRIDYVLHCSGCHASDGRGLTEKGIPALKDQIGYYLTLPEGRAFLMQVPGLLSAGLSDERAAGVTNWIMTYFAGPSLPADFVPFTRDEAMRYRLAKPADIAAKRKQLAQQLIAAGYPFN